MAGEWTRTKWDALLWKIAEEAAKSRMEKKDLSGYSQLKIDAIQRELEHTAKKQLDKDFPFSKLKDTEKNEFLNWKGEEAGNYLLGGGTESYRKSFNPLAKKKMDDFAKLGPLVLGLADEGRDWYSMGAEDLFAEGEKLGYDTKSKKGKMDFLRDVGDVQQAHERGKLLEEFNKENSVWSDLFYPTLMEEARKQITTGRGTQEQLDEAKKLDMVVNAAMGAAPIIGDLGKSAAYFKAAGAASKSKPVQVFGKLHTPLASLEKAPVISGTLGAATQGILEAERQAVKERSIDPELEADYTNALLAFTSGAIRPGMIGTAATLTQQVPGRAPARFSRGVMGATRRGNPTNAERDELGYAFDVYDKLFRNARKGINTKEKAAADNIRKAADEAKKLVDKNAADEQRKLIIENYGTPVKLPDMEKGRLAEKLVDKLQAMYGADDANKMLANGSKERLLADYDALGNMFVTRNPNNFYKKVLDDYELVNGKLKPGNYLSGLEQAFPNKMAEAYGNDKWYKAGLRAGEILGTLGGSIEPVLKVNPFGPLSGGRLNIVNTDYKDTKWYKSLSKKQQEAFDDAYQKSKKKESE